MFWLKRFAVGTIVLVLLILGAIAQAAISTTDKISDVRGTKHNFSAVQDGSSTPSGGKVPSRTVKASSETQVCVFCHTPHEAEQIAFGSGANAYGGPLWNRKLSGQTYATYNSSSMDADAAELAAAPGGSSKLCLSCHDGTMAIDKVNALNGAKNVTIPMAGGASPVTMPGNSTTGFTRNLSTNLTSDHPISFTYDATLASNDGELRGPDGTIVGTRVAGATAPKMPLEKGQMQCSTCHDPHLRDKAAGNGNAKFLRMNRFQVSQPAGGNFNTANDIVCLACHNKGGASWAFSAHANSSVATQLYKPASAQQREFPSSLDTPANTEPPVWQVSCLNCHDTHSVQGARRLLREGTDSTTIPKAGGNAALEETCYQCHTTTGESAVTYTAGTSTAVPDIKTDFTTLARHMPIKSSEQAAGAEVHDIGGVFNDSTEANCSKTTGKCGKDLLESRANLGATDLGKRHAECSDCHNPHRVVRFRDFRGNPAGVISGAPDAAGTHPHTDDANTLHSNIASGVLRGSWGVEPIFSSNSFHAMPSNFAVKRGDPGGSATAQVSDSYVTREYQICLKCHSNYGFTDNNLYPAGNRPTLGAPGTPSGTNGMTMYTNLAKEVQAPATHQGPATNTCINQGTDAGANSAWNTCNHRSWHPVMNATGRTTTTRRMSGGNPWLAPWNNQVGSNTMYCSDCHGSNTGANTVIPTNGDNGSPWGPHGSNNDFLLKGNWTDTTGSDTNLLCFKCHNKTTYTSRNDTGRTTGFYDGSTGKGNLHNYHVDRIGKELRCTWCHVAVPHGWKNKALLVNLNDVGEEAGQGVGSSKEVATSGINHVYTQQPYYFKAKLKVRSFATSGAWADTNCGSSGKTGSNLIAGSGGLTNTTGSGKNWMISTCDNPP